VPGIEGARRPGEHAADDVGDAFQIARTVKGELEKVYRTDTDFDVTVDVDAEDEAKLAALPHVTIGGASVGYEERSSRSLDGATYSKHFRAIWKHDGRTIGVSYYTREEIDARAFVELLAHLVPIVERAV
jgi:hypothetical protein